MHARMGQQALQILHALLSGATCIANPVLELTFWAPEKLKREDWLSDGTIGISGRGALSGLGVGESTDWAVPDTHSTTSMLSRAMVTTSKSR